MKGIITRVAIYREVDLERFAECFDFVRDVRMVRIFNGGCEFKFKCNTTEEVLKVREKLFTSPLVRSMTFTDLDRKVATYECGVREMVYEPHTMINKNFNIKR